MARNRHAVQTNFTGGEISSRMLMRADTDVYQKSVLAMENFYPTLQGSTERPPGNRFVLDTGLKSGRIFPYLTPTNKRALILLGEDWQGNKSIRMWDDINEGSSRGGISAGVATTQSTITVRRQIINNFNFLNGVEDWELDPAAEPGYDGNLIGAWWKPRDNGSMNLRPRKYKYNEPTKVTIRGQGTVDEATNAVSILFAYQFLSNSPLGGGRKFSIKIGTTQGGSDLLDYISNADVGDYRERTFVADLPNPGWTGEVYVEISLEAIEGVEENNSTPWFRMHYCGVWANKTVDLGEQVIEIRNAAGNPVPDPPWLLRELKDIHYVQSPYNREVPDQKPSKELVLTHRNHPPYRLYFNTIDLKYVLEPIDFVNQPVLWSAGNYPATCTSCMGRLILAGGNNSEEAIDSTNGSNTETVWATKVAKWDEFSQPDEVNADDSLEFTTIYRSPIQWVHGQKELFVGTLEMEYIARADGIYAPNDLGTDMHSTHGGARIQPVGLGVGVAFAAENGTRMRLMRGSNEDMGFIAQDLTLFHPEILQSGVRRMQRMRNPHQMVVCVLNDGTMGLYHFDPQGDVMAWSRINVGDGSIEDAAVLADNASGDDNLYQLVRRDKRVNEGTLYLEVIDNWVSTERWHYLQQHVIHSEEAAFSTIGAPGSASEGLLDHLEGKRVMVSSDRGYLGVYKVESGQISLEDDTGVPYEVIWAAVGTQMESELRTLPVVPITTGDPGAVHRYVDISLRTRGSSRPKVQVLSFNERAGESIQRAEDRTPGTVMDNPEPLDLINDIEAANLGSDIYQVVVVRETLPLRCEILGIYGKLSGESL